MAIDPSIILGIRPQAASTFADPMETYSKGLTLRTLMGQGQLQDLQLKQAQQSQTDDQTLRALTAGAIDPTTGVLDPKKLLGSMYKGGLVKQAQAYEKGSLENDKSRAEVGKIGAETGKISSEAVGGTLKNFQSMVPQLSSPQAIAAWYTAQYKDPIIGPFLQSQQPLEAALQHVPQNPADIAAWQQNAGLNMEQAIQHKEHIATLAETVRNNMAQNRASMISAGAAASNAGTAAARLKFEQSQPQGQVLPEQGVIVDKRTGISIPITDRTTGAPLAPKDKLTESQGKASGMALRAQRANDILNTLEDSGQKNRGNIKQAAGGMPFVGRALETGVNMLPGALGGPSSDQQRVEQARRDFVNAALRVESGASISESEFRNAEAQYFPMPGDSPDVIAQKRQSRANEIEGLRVQAGPGTNKVTSLPKADAPVKIKGDDGYNALPKGAQYIGPDGIARIKP